ncbi:hypothetical protein L9F63_003167, partial [Diploptera punctata]
WKDITNVINHKRSFGIECQFPEETLHYYFSDPESAKYVWRMCVHQQYIFTFRMFFEQASEPNNRIALEICGFLSLMVWGVGGKNTGKQWLRALLPSYRPAPDYETAMQQKYRDSSSGIFLHTITVISIKEHRVNIHKSENIIFHDTPELDTVENHMIQGLQLLHLYKPPPPYPSNRPSSNSTPDLASKTCAPPQPTFINPHVSGSSPDLVSSRSLGPIRHQQPHHHHHHHQMNHHQQHYLDPSHQLLPNPEAHRTYTNLAAVMDTQQHVHLEDHRRAFAEEPNLVYCMGGSGDVGLLLENRPRSTTMPYHSVNSISSGSQYAGGAPEPIYENVPLPWAADGRAAAEVSSSSSNTVSGKKPKRKWGLLVGGKTKSNSSKSNTNTLPKETTPDEDTSKSLQQRWSTGLPRLPLPATISKETMCQLLERKLADTQLFFEFESIPKKKTNADFTSGLHPDNIARNRYKDVLPYEENRVRLIPSKENKHGYINASHITATVGHQQRFYIAAQGPLPNTVGSFWQMIWEADVYLVVMLTGFQEEGSAVYCPGVGDRGLEVGEFQVWRQFTQETGHCVTTKLRLYHTSSRRVRGIWHLQYLEWGDQGCPHNVGHFLGFLEELSSVRQHTVSEIPAGHNRNTPVLVHCNAGVGRTGVTVLSDLLLYTLDHNQEMDIPRVVVLLRHQRMMLQTVAQTISRQVCLWY